LIYLLFFVEKRSKFINTVYSYKVYIIASEGHIIGEGTEGTQHPTKFLKVIWSLVLPYKMEAFVIIVLWIISFKSFILQSIPIYLSENFGRNDYI
jgi:hypothetical protein